MGTKFGNWQHFLDNCLAAMVENGEFDGFRSLENDRDRVEYVHSHRILERASWIESYFDSCSSCPCKSARKARKWRLEGNESFKKRDFTAALQRYNQSLLHAPVRTETSPAVDEEAALNAVDDQTELALGFANRSAVLFHLGKYEWCVSDVDLALQNGYPLHLCHKLHQRRGQCWAKLGDVEAATQAYTMADKLLAEDQQDQVHENTDMLRNTLAQMMRNLKANSKGSPPNMQQTDVLTKLPSPTGGCSEVLAQASSAIELAWSAAKGRHLLAKQPLKAGDVLIVERPFAAVLLPSHVRSHCHHCFVQLSRPPIPCEHCCSVKFCTVSCRTEAMSTYHHIECPYLDLLYSIGIAHLSLRIVLVAGLQSLLGFRAQMQKPSSETPRVAGMSEDGQYKNDYLTVYELMPHSNNMADEDLFQYTVTAALLLKCLVHSKFFQQDFTFTAASANSRQDGSSSSLMETTDPHLQRGLKGKEEEKGRSGVCPSKCPSSDSVVSSSAKDLRKEVEYVSPSRVQLGSNCGTEQCLDSDSTGFADEEDRVKLKARSEATGEATVDYVGGLLLRHICQLVCNAHAITELQVTTTTEATTVAPSLVDTESQERVATAIYPTASLMNHSCDPTIISSFHQDSLIVRAAKDVALGGEIFNCYGPHYKRMSRQARQQSLREQYFFTCRCHACTSPGTEGDEEDLSQAFKCPECNGAVAATTKSHGNCKDCGYHADIASMERVFLETLENFKEGLQKLSSGDSKGAQACLETCHEGREAVLHKHNRDLSEVEDALAKCHASQGNFAASARFLKRSIATTLAVYGGKSVEYANELHKYAEVLVNAGQFVEALQATNTAIGILTVLYGGSHPIVLELYKLKHCLEQVQSSG